MDQCRCEDRSEPECPHEDALDDAHHPRQHVIRSRALQERHACDVDDGRAEPHQRQPDERRRRMGDQRDENEGQARDDEAEPERRCESRARNEAKSGDSAEQAADPDGRRQEADPGLADVERLEGEHDDQDVRRARHEGLHAVKPDDQAQANVVRNRSEPGEGLLEEARLRDVCLRRPID